MNRCLSDCVENEIIEILEIKENKYLNRLLELGLTPEVKVRVVQKNFSIMCILVRNTIIGIRKELANEIIVKEV